MNWFTHDFSDIGTLQFAEQRIQILKMATITVGYFCQQNIHSNHQTLCSSHHLVVLKLIQKYVYRLVHSILNYGTFFHSFSFKYWSEIETKLVYPCRQPAWGIRLILEALVSFLPTPGDGAIGALDWTSAERKRLAKKSVDYVCPICGKCSDILKKIEQKIARKGGLDKDKKPSRFQKQIAELHALQLANHTEDADESKEVDEKASDDVKVQDESSPQATETEDNNEDAAEDNNEDTAVDSNVETLDVPATEQDDGKKGDDIFQNGIDENDASNATVTDTETTHEQQNTRPFVEEVKITKENDNCEQSDDMDAQSLVQEVEKEEGNTSDLLQEVEVEEALLQDENSLNTPLLSDPIIHSGIVIFSIIVWLLVRKLSAVIDDLKALEAEIQSLK